MVRLENLAEVFAQLNNHHDPRGKRHPLPGVLSLVFLGLLEHLRR